jgi:hypothetical protein
MVGRQVCTIRLQSGGRKDGGEELITIDSTTNSMTRSSVNYKGAMVME